MLTKITAKFQVGNASYSPNITFGYNKLRQVTKKTTGSLFYRAFSYKTNQTTYQTSEQIDYMNYRKWVSNNQTGELILGYRYYYNDLGGISKICPSLASGGADEDHPLQTYTYDKLGQLRTCVDSVAGVTYKYYYDTAGNLRNMKELVDEVETSSKWLYYTDTIWHDRLSKVTVGGTSENIVYETAISGYISGNPISYYNGRHYDFTWKNGRQLASASVNGMNVTYEYDMAGVRSKKTVGNTEYTYDTLGGLVVHQHWEDTKDLYFIYDDNNQPYAVFYKNGSGSLYRYYYLLNQQGDVVALMNGNHEKVVKYRYDPWGVPTLVSDSTNIRIGEKNPLLYRGYYYDSDTGLYYLQSRYYDPAIGRFINADTFATTDANGFLSCNMFAYCENDPVNRSDCSGTISELLAGVIGGTIAGAVINGAAYCLSNSSDFDCWEFVLAVGIGAFE
ncbi:MAG: RHS repeat-associated core domain-containing protein, partial [Bacteroidales bacterium]|nr:RHS repeat-associated core domain-containing protein [Bacteroidales bacterium]